MAALARPFDVRAEIINIEMALAERLRSERVRVPTYPAVCTRLQAVIADPRCSARAIAEIVATDPALSATLLRHAMSAAMRGASASLTLENAITRLGASEIVRIAVETTLGRSALGGGPLAALRRDVWRRALISARLAAMLAPPRRVDPGAAFVAGLLHDFGAVVVVATLEDVANERRLAVLPEHAWRDLTTKYHVEFGTVMGERWQLPPDVMNVVAGHHDPAVQARDPVVALVALVDQIIDLLDARGDDGLAALSSVPGLAAAEVSAIGAALPRLADQMASFDVPAAAAAAPSLVAPVVQEDPGWPCAVAVKIKGETAPVQALWHDRFALQTKKQLQPNWLVNAVMQTQPALDLLVNIRSCEPDGRGGYIAIAQPYALAGTQKAQWLQLIAQARAASR